MKNWSKREYQPRVVNMNAEAEFAVEFPEAPNPWGQGFDDLIARAQSDSPGLDRTFLGIRVERCTFRAKRIQLLAHDDATKADVMLVARTLHPDIDWEWNDLAVIKPVRGGWLITLQM